MTDPNEQTTTTITTGPTGPTAGAAETEPLTAEMLVEEVSIDGMCGVY